MARGGFAMVEDQERKVLEWMAIFKQLYEDVDSARSPEHLWLAVMAHCSCMGEAIRKNAYSDLLYHTMHTFSWMCSFVNKLNTLEEDVFALTGCLSGIVALKYPDYCGYCKLRICACHAGEVDSVVDKAPDYGKLVKDRAKIVFKDYSLGEWLRTFDRIYGSKVHALPLEIIGFHFLEEAGEVALAVRSLSQLSSIHHQGIEGIDRTFLRVLTTVENVVEKWEECKDCEITYVSEDPAVLRARLVSAKLHLIAETADTFSWLCSVLNKVTDIYKENRFGLVRVENMLQKEYLDENGTPTCPTCGKQSCKCVFFC
jgi:NTP pyrophosphatase (non-canonical NTP hydrolase)